MATGVTRIDAASATKKVIHKVLYILIVAPCYNFSISNPASFNMEAAS